MLLRLFPNTAYTHALPITLIGTVNSAYLSITDNSDFGVLAPDSTSIYELDVNDSKLLWSFATGPHVTSQPHNIAAIVIINYSDMITADDTTQLTIPITIEPMIDIMQLYSFDITNLVTIYVENSKYDWQLKLTHNNPAYQPINMQLQAILSQSSSLALPIPSLKSNQEYIGVKSIESVKYLLQSLNFSTSVFTYIFKVTFKTTDTIGIWTTLPPPTTIQSIPITSLLGNKLIFNIPKCIAQDAQVLMHDNTYKLIQDVQVGDKVLNDTESSLSYYLVSDVYVTTVKNSNVDLVVFEKDSILPNIPTSKLIMTSNHLIVSSELAYKFNRSLHERLIPRNLTNKTTIRRYVNGYQVYSKSKKPIGTPLTLHQITGTNQLNLYDLKLVDAIDGNVVNDGYIVNGIKVKSRAPIDQTE